MTKSKMANRYSPEVRARAVRMVFEHQGSYETQAGAIAAIAPKIGCIPQTLSGWVKQAEKDSGMRDGVTTEERDRIKALERENREPRQWPQWAVLTQCRCGHEARQPGTCIGPHRLMMMWLSGAQAFDNESLFPRHADGWIPSGFRGD